MSLTVVEYLEIHHGSKSCMTFCRCPTASHCYPCEGDSLVHPKGYDCTCSCPVCFHSGVQLTPPLFCYVTSFWGVCLHSYTCIFSHLLVGCRALKLQSHQWCVCSWICHGGENHSMPLYA